MTGICATSLVPNSPERLVLHTAEKYNLVIRKVNNSICREWFRLQYTQNSSDGATISVDYILNEYKFQ